VVPFFLFTATMTVPCAGISTSCAAASAATTPPVTGHLGDMVTGVTHAGNQLAVSYVPASAFWPLQLVIGGCYLAGRRGGGRHRFLAAAPQDHGRRRGR
jgi:hypothetical protein